MFEQEKMDWLKSIRAVKLPEPVIYIYTIPGEEGCFLLSERGIREKSVEELQEMYFKTVKANLELGLRDKIKNEGDFCVGKTDKDTN